MFQRRVTEPFATVKKLLDNGELGKLILGDLYMKYYRSQEYYDSGGWRGTWKFDGGDALMNQGIHMIDLLQWYMGPVESVFGYCKTLARKIEVEDTAAVVLKFKNGAIGVIEGTTSVYPPTIPHRLEIHGEHGTIMFSGTSPTDISWEGHQKMIAGMVEAIRQDREPIITGEEGKKALEIILAIYESAKTGREIKLPFKR